MAFALIVTGMGRRGTEWARQLQEHSDYELAACADPDPAALERAGTEFGLPPERRFASFEAALDGVECDAVIVATPPSMHVEPCETAFSRELPVLVEKPFTESLADAATLVEQAEKRGLPLVVGHNYRYMRATRAASRLVREGAIGRVGMAVSHYYNVPAHLGPKEGMRHAALWGSGIHHVDALLHVLDQKLTGVIADAFSAPWTEGPGDTSMRVMFDFEDGCRAMYSATYDSNGHEFFEKGQEYYARFLGEEASLHVFQRWLFLCRPGRRPRLIRRGSRPMTEEVLLLEQLRGAIATGEEAESSGRANLRTMAAVEAILRSNEERRWIDPGQLLAQADPPRQ